jgi:iron complex outermembrane receptor protein
MRYGRFVPHPRLLGVSTPRRSVSRVGPALVWGLLLVTPAASSQNEEVVEDDSQDVELPVDTGENEFASMSLEELMNVSVTSVLGTEDSWFSTPAALTVITNEDLRRTGHRSIVEALRLVPGFTVAQIDSHNWAVGSRGFAGQFANKLQVLRDGRRLYDPLFSGVYWDVQHYPFEDIDRIEVIRGPGATLWGANAVNGVINITTKSAADTQGLYISGGGGTYHQGFGTVRYGGALGEDDFFRVYGTYQNNDNFAGMTGGRAPDDWSMNQGGFRFDFGTKSDTTITVQGDAFYTGHLGEGWALTDPTVHFGTIPTIGDARTSGANVLLKLDHTVSDTEGWTFQAYYDRFDRASTTDFRYLRNSADVDFRHRFMAGEHHQIIWGLNYRHDRDDITNAPPTISVIPDQRSMDLFSAFIQDTITLVPDRLFGMIGSKFEHNDFTGFEIQPSARMWWTPDDSQTLWGAISRPVRTPSRAEDDALIILQFADPGLLMGGPPAGFLIPLPLMGSRSVESETVLTCELGYRRKFGDSLTLDIAGHYSDYEDVIAIGPDGVFDNLNTAEAYGVEIASTWEAADNWRVKGSYTFLRTNVHGPGAMESGDGSHPQHQFQLQSFLDITEDLEFNAALYYTDNVPAFLVGDYVRLDLGLTWRPSPNLEIAVWGQNLLDSQHLESAAAVFTNTPAAVERSAYLQATLRF